MTGRREGQKTLKELFQAAFLTQLGSQVENYLPTTGPVLCWEGGAQFSGLENGSVTVGLESTEN